MSRRLRAAAVMSRSLANSQVSPSTFYPIENSTRIQHSAQRTRHETLEAVPIAHHDTAVGRLEYSVHQTAAHLRQCLRGQRHGAATVSLHQLEQHSLHLRIGNEIAGRSAATEAVHSRYRQRFENLAR